MCLHVHVYVCVCVKMEQTVACLRGEAPPPGPRAPCPPVAVARGGASSDCLRAPVPAWTVPHARVMACFRCCLHDALARAGLRRNVPTMLDLLYNRSFNPWWRGHFDADYRQHGAAGASWGVATRAAAYAPTSALLGDIAFLRLAHAAVGYYSTSDWTVASRPPPGGRSLVVVQGYTRAHPAALATLREWLRSDRGPVRGKITLLVSGDQYLPSAPEPLLEQLDERLNRVEIGVHNPNRALPDPGGRLFAFPRGLAQTSVWDALLARPEHAAAQLARDRPQLLHCSCIRAFRHPLRRAKMDALRANGFACEEECAPGAGHPRALRSKFAFSPRGNSAQNYRDWESLLAGAIPLVDADPALDGLYDGLPVVRVRNWSTITPAHLEALWRTMRASDAYAWEKLYLPYWLARVLDL